MNAFLMIKRESLSVKTVTMFSFSNRRLICLTPNLKFLARTASRLTRLIKTLSRDSQKWLFSILSRSQILWMYSQYLFQWISNPISLVYKSLNRIICLTLTYFWSFITIILRMLKQFIRQLEFSKSLSMYPNIRIIYFLISYSSLISYNYKFNFQHHRNQITNFDSVFRLLHYQF